MYNFIKKLNQLNADPSFTKEEKTQIINEVFSNYRKQVDKDYRNYLAKQYAGEALQLVGALPQGRVAKLGMQYFGIPAAKHLGRNIAQQTGAGMFSGATAGGLFGLGHGLSTDQNPLKTGAIGVGTGALFGGSTGAIFGKGNEIYQAGKLKSFGNIDTLNDAMRKQYRQTSKKYYQDFIQGRVIDKDGDINFGKRGLSEISRWNPKQGKNYPELIQDIINAQGPFRAENLDPAKTDVSHFDVYHGQNGNHYIEVLNNGYRRFYVTKDNILNSKTFKGRDRATSTGANEGFNNIINHNEQNFNPQAENITLSGYISKDVNKPQNAFSNWLNRFRGNTTGQAAQVDFSPAQSNPYYGFRNPLTGNNKIYTRQDLNSMPDNEFEQNEKEIMSQVKTPIGIPREDEIKPYAQNNNGVVYIKPYTRSDGVQVRGHYRAI